MNLRLWSRRELVIGSVLGTLGACQSNRALANTRYQDRQFRLSSGRLLGYRVYGEQLHSPLLYFHGSPGSRIEAELIAERCSAHRFCLIAIDRPGLGLSTFSGGHSVASWPNDICEFMTAMSDTYPDPFRVLAVSGGTAFALACAATLAPAIRSIAIISPRTPFAPGVPDGALDPDLRQLRRHPRLASIALKSQGNRLKRNPSFTPKALNKYASVDQRYMRQHSQVLRRTLLEAGRNGVEGILQDLRLMTWPWCVPLQQIQIPVGLWLGECDFSAPKQTLAFLQSQIKTAQPFIVRGQGHYSILEHAADAALSWLRSHETLN